MEFAQTRSAGGIVLGDNGTIALVKSRNSKSWLFPKGHVEAEEDDETAARREIAEEAGLTDLELIDDLGEFTRPTVTAQGQLNEQKTLKMYLFAAPRGATLAPTMEIDEARWFNYREVSEILGTPHADWFAADRAWFAKVFERVRQAIQRD